MLAFKRASRTYVLASTSTRNGKEAFSFRFSLRSLNTARGNCWQLLQLHEVNNVNKKEITKWKFSQEHNYVELFYCTHGSK